MREVAIVQAVLWSKVLRIRHRSWIWEKQDFEMYEIWSEKQRLESKITPRFRAEETGCIVIFEEIVSVGLWILASCAGRPMRRNSVIVGLRDRKLEAIHEEISEIVFCKSWIFSEKASAENDRKSWVSSALSLWLTDDREIIVLSRVV